MGHQLAIFDDLGRFWGRKRDFLQKLHEAGQRSPDELKTRNFGQTSAAGALSKPGTTARVPDLGNIAHLENRLIFHDFGRFWGRKRDFLQKCDPPLPLKPSRGWPEKPRRAKDSKLRPNFRRRGPLQACYNGQGPRPRQHSAPEKPTFGNATPPKFHRARVIRVKL